MRLLADRPVGHRAGLEALDDLGGGLHFVQRHGRSRRFERQQAAEGRQLLLLGVHLRAVLLEDAIVRGLAGALQLVDGLWIVEVVLAVVPPLDVAAHLQGAVAAVPFGVAAQVAGRGLGRDLLQAHAGQARRRAGEVTVHHVAADAHRLEHLRSLVALDGRDPHLGDDLDDALQQRLAVVVAGAAVELLVMDARAVAGRRVSAACTITRAIPVAAVLLRIDEQPLVDAGIDALVGQVGTDGAGAVAEQHGHVMHLARLARFDHEPHQGARAGADQVVVDGRGGEQGRDRRVLRVHAPVGEDDHRRSRGDGGVGLPEHAFERF